MTGLREAIRSTCRHFRAAHGLPGLAVSVLRGSESVLAEGFGVADLEQPLPVTADTVFEIASVTKPFTAEAVLLLVQDGRVALDAPLTGYLRSHPAQLELPAAWETITVRQALAHQSGIRSYTAVDAYWQRTRDDRTPRELLALVDALPLDFTPGARYAYDNTGYYLLGLLIEAVSGRPYGAFLEERLLGPLGLHDTRVNDYAAVIPGRARGYSRRGGRRDGRLINKAYYSTANTFAAGQLLSTVRDLGRWMAKLDGPPLAPELRRLRWTPHPSGAGNERQLGFTLGLGWFLLDFGGRYGDQLFVGHNGGIQGFASTLLHRPEDQLTVVALMNGDWLNEPHQLALELLELL